jgi:carbon starvation protein CstA
MSALASSGNGIQTKLLWAAVAALGAVSFGIVALTRGESVNAAWLVIAAICVYFISYRFYALFVANKALGVDTNRQTPAWRHNAALAVTLWGYFLYVGVIDPLGGIFTLWPLFGTANQMLAAIALTLCTVVLFKMKHERFAWVTVVPAVWLVATTVTAGLEKVFNTDPDVGFVSHALQFGRAAAAGQVLAPAETLEEMSRIIFNDYVDATLSALFVAVVVASVVYGFLNIRKALGSLKATAIEVGEAQMAGAVAGGGNV